MSREERQAASWKPRVNSHIVTRRDTGEVVCEMWEASLAGKINTEVYRVQTAYDYLCQMNFRLKLENEELKGTQS